MKFWLLFLFCATQLFAYSKSGLVYTTDGSLSDVNAAITDASTGNVITIPAGSFTWGTSAAYVNLNKAVSLIGAGTASSTVTLSTDFFGYSRPSTGSWSIGAIQNPPCGTLTATSLFTP